MPPFNDIIHKAWQKTKLYTMICVNFATDQFKKGQKRLADSIVERGGTIVTYNDYKQIGSPTHQESPYEFKIHALAKTMLTFKNEDIFLWCDASLYAVGDLSKIEKIIQEDGYFMEEAGHYVKDWCNSHTRNWFNLAPDEHHYTMFSAGLLGLKSTSSFAMTFFKGLEMAAQGGCFKGSWKDHRHDMTCGSILANRFGMKYQRGGSHMAYIGPGYAKPEEGVVFHLQGII